MGFGRLGFRPFCAKRGAAVEPSRLSLRKRAATGMSTAYAVRASKRPAFAIPALHINKSHDGKRSQPHLPALAMRAEERQR